MTLTTPPGPESSFRTPKWVWGIILALALIEPAVHLGIVLFPPSGAVPTGLHVVDTASFRTAMRHCLGDRESPYARLDSSFGARDPSLFVLPHYYLYGAVGWIGRLLHVPEFHALAWANGLSLAFTLWAAYRLLRIVTPDLACTAFLIFSLSGGLGGLLYLAAATCGVTDDPRFPVYFERHFLYELCEGAQFQPWLLATRLYYTFPMGLGFWAFSEMIRAFGEPNVWRFARALPALSLACWANARFAGPYVMIAILWLLLEQGAPLRRRAAAAGSIVVAAVPMAAWVAGMAWSRPELASAVPQGGGPSIWFTAFLSAACFHLLLAVSPLVKSVRFMPAPVSRVAWMAMGYVGAFAAGMGLYYAYYGNVFACYDSTAAVHISGWALLGLPCGLAAGAFTKRTPYGMHEGPQPSGTMRQVAWFSLWFLALSCLGVSALGEGALVEFARNRVKVLLGLPLAVLAAAGLQSLGAKHPRLSRACLAVMLIAGIASMSVTWAVTHGPLGFRGLQRQFPWTANLYMSEADARLIERIPKGVVLAPSLGSPLFGDVIVQRPGYATVYGNPTLDFSREFAPEVRARAAEFFKPGAAETSRRALIEAWSVDSVYCPDTVPIEPASIAELRALPWLREIAAEGRGVVFTVTPSKSVRSAGSDGSVRSAREPPGAVSGFVLRKILAPDAANAYAKRSEESRGARACVATTQNFRRIGGWLRQK